MSRPARVEIDVSAATHNLSTVQSLIGSSKILAVVKADAYGHGLGLIAKGFGNADAFGVVSTEEAIVLRELNIPHRIVLLEGFFDKRELEIIRELRLEPVVHSHAQIEILRESGLTLSAIWLKIDTGMNRLGFDAAALDDVYKKLRPLSGNIILMSHLANANLPNNLSVEEQIKKFGDVTLEYSNEKSLANSGGVLKWRSSYFDWVRPGLILYGVSPFPGVAAESLGLKPVMKVLSNLISVRHVKAGEPVGYGGDYVCPEDMTIGVAAYGYADGYPRRLETGPPVLVRNARAKIVSSSMDMMILDLRGVENPNVGDEVTLWGKNLPVEEVSTALDTIPYELLCSVRRRSRHREFMV